MHELLRVERGIAECPSIYEGKKKLYTSRDILQFVGTEIMRRYYPAYHLRVCLEGLPKDRNSVICDVRYPNEGTAINDRDGFCVNIVRDTHLKAERNLLHKSEIAMRGWSGWFSDLDNTEDGYECLYTRVDNLLEEIQYATRRR